MPICYKNRQKRKKKLNEPSAAQSVYLHHQRICGILHFRSNKISEGSQLIYFDSETPYGFSLTPNKAAKNLILFSAI